MASATRKTPAPVAAEVLGENVPFVHEGETFLALPTTEWSGEALEAFEDGKVMTFLRAIVAPSDFPKVRAMKAAQLGDFVVSLQKGLGIRGN